MSEEPMRAEIYTVPATGTREEQLFRDLVASNDEANRLRDRVAELERMLAEAHAQRS
jgi:hypothetical protein